MKLHDGNIRLSSRDLTGHVNCQHLTQLELQAAAGALRRPKPWDPTLEALWERGFRHERDFVQSLREEGLRIVTIEGVDVDDASVELTVAAMRDGADGIVQAALRSGNWIGRADVLRRVETASDLGAWSYEPYDTKLSRETNASTILQLCLYSEMLSTMQGKAPEHMHVVTPWSEFVPQTYRVAEFAAYFRRVKEGLTTTIATTPAPTT